MSIPDNVPSQCALGTASIIPSRASTWFFSGQLHLPQTFSDDMDASNEIPASFILDAFNLFSGYQASRMALLKIFSFSFDSDRSTFQPGSPLIFSGFVAAQPQSHIRYGTLRDWMPALILNWTAVSGRRDQHPLIVSFLAESALREDRMALSGGGTLKLRVDLLDPSGAAVSKGGSATSKPLVSPAVAALDWRWHGPAAGCSRRPSPLSTGDGMGFFLFPRKQCLQF